MAATLPKLRWSLQTLGSFWRRHRTPHPGCQGKVWGLHKVYEDLSIFLTLKKDIYGDSVLLLLNVVSLYGSCWVVAHSHLKLAAWF